jgi:hypothetical protein
MWPVTTVTDHDLAADVAAAVDARLAQRIADAQRRQADRARRAAARTAGLRARHATKLARIRPTEPTGDL